MAGKIIFYQRIIESMNEGVMALSPKGTVTMFNNLAGDILGLSPEEVRDKPFGQVFMMEMEENDQFCQVILDAVYDTAVGRTETTAFKRPDGQERILSLSTSYLRPEKEGESESAGVVVVINDITEITQSREKEKELNLKLRDAFIDAEETNKKLKSALKKVQVIRLFVTLAVILGFGGMGYYLWQQDLMPTAYFSGEKTGSGNMDQVMNRVPVRVQPLNASISLSGNVAPLEEINVVAPYDGKIKERFFVYDQKVEKGARLFSMDTSQLEKSFRDAKSAYIKAMQSFRQLQQWDRSSEVSSSRRSFTKAKNSLDAAQRKLEESRLLFEKGIISRSEFESAESDYENQQMDLTAARESLDAVMEKASPENKNISGMELANARTSLDEVEQKLKNTVVYAPVSGIIIMPTGGNDGGMEGGSGKKRVEAGVSVNQGDILVSIGNLDGLSVKARVDEIDIGKIDFGMKVNVTGDAFSDIPMTGRVRQISSNAVSQGMEGPMFDVGIAIDRLTGDQKKSIRLGMSANLSIIVYENPKALMVPLDGVMIRKNKKFVQVIRQGSKIPEKVQVTTGMTTLDSVEILSGLEPGDQIVLGGPSLPESVTPADEGRKDSSLGDIPGPAGGGSDPPPVM